MPTASAFENDLKLMPPHGKFTPGMYFPDKVLKRLTTCKQKNQLYLFRAWLIRYNGWFRAAVAAIIHYPDDQEIRT